ncbi:MAG: LysR family transcriptional regulator [Gemmatimonadaceae bacterium]
MDLDTLRTFLAVHRAQSFSGAVGVLHRTQPALSRRIALLERELGAPVFERTPGGVVLSEAGRALLPHAERAVAAMQDAAHAVRALGTATAGSVALAVVGTLAGRALAGVLRRFAADHPRVELTLRTARSAEVSELVRRGTATLGVRYERDRSPDLEVEEFGAEALRVVCAPEHPLAGREIAALASLRHERWLAFPEIPGQRELAASHVFGVFLAHGLGEVDWTPVDSLTAQKRLVEAGFGLALLPASNAEEELATGTIAMVHVADLRAGLPVVAVTRRGGFLSVAAQRLRELFRHEYTAQATSRDATDR